MAEAGGGRMWVVTSIRQRYAGHATQAAMLACSCQPGALMTKYSIVVDEDVYKRQISARSMGRLSIC